MTNMHAGAVSHLFELSEEEAITLRRIAFGESENRSLRREDIERLLGLRLVKANRNGDLDLTISGREHFEALPRVSLTEKPKRRGGAY
jgi:hypothetical protein